jgi:hypothetical protein
VNATGNPAIAPEAFTLVRFDRAGRTARVCQARTAPTAAWMLTTATSLSFVETIAQGSVIITTVSTRRTPPPHCWRCSPAT